MVVLERNESGVPTVWCDPEIVDIVGALNKGGCRTAASCSGHGHRPGWIALADGRQLAIAPDLDTMKAIFAACPAFPLDANGDALRPQVELNFPEVGRAGPFHVDEEGVVTVPSATMQDLFARARMGYVRVEGDADWLPSVGEEAFDPNFGGGAHFKVKRIIPPNGKAGWAKRGWRLAVELTFSDGTTAKRVIGKESWQHFKSASGKGRNAANG